MLRPFVAAVAALLLLPAGASAAADIEAVWEFGGGAVAVAANPDGTFTGTVTRETRLVQCVHPVGEQMWTGVTAQPDGEYWGGHQWFSNPGCKVNPDLGKSAFRVLPDGKGGRFLKICLSNPSSDLQPRIAPDGTNTDTAAGCINSAIVSALPTGTPTIEQIAPGLPTQGKKRCFSKRRFTIHLKNPKGDPLKSARVYLNGKRVKVKHKGKRFTARINLHGRKKGRYTVRIVAKTVLGKTIKGKRKYRTCAKKRTATA